MCLTIVCVCTNACQCNNELTIVVYLFVCFFKAGIVVTPDNQKSASEEYYK